MAKVDTTCKVKVYERNGNDVPIGENRDLIVESHWNRDSLVVLTVPWVKGSITVARSDLEKAIRNCTNV